MAPTGDTTKNSSMLASIKLAFMCDGIDLAETQFLDWQLLTVRGHESDNLCLEYEAVLVTLHFKVEGDTQN